MKWKSFKNNTKSISLICNLLFKTKSIRWIILWLNQRLTREMKLTKFKRQWQRNLRTSVLTNKIKLEFTQVWSCSRALWRPLNFRLMSISTMTWKWWIKRKRIFLITKSKVWTNNMLMNSSNYFYSNKGMEGTKVTNLITMALKIMEMVLYNIQNLLPTLTT